jgi:hypothetical protein
MLPPVGGDRSPDGGREETGDAMAMIAVLSGCVVENFSRGRKTPGSHRRSPA